MSPVRVNQLPSPASLPSYGISENGFLPAELPLTRLPHAYYLPWEGLLGELPELLKAGQWRQRVDELPVLDTSHLETEREWQRAYSMLAVMAQAYIWQGPEPSEVREAQQPLLIDLLTVDSVCLLQSLCLSSQPQSTSRSVPLQRTLL